MHALCSFPFPNFVPLCPSFHDPFSTFPHARRLLSLLLFLPRPSPRCTLFPIFFYSLILFPVTFFFPSSLFFSHLKAAYPYWPYLICEISPLPSTCISSIQFPSHLPSLLLIAVSSYYVPCPFQSSPLFKCP